MDPKSHLELDNPAFVPEDVIEMEESRRKELQNNTGSKMYGTSLKAENMDKPNMNGARINSPIKEFDPHLSFRLSVLVCTIIFAILWAAVHFSLIQDYSSSDMDM